MASRQEERVPSYEEDNADESEEQEEDQQEKEQVSRKRQYRQQGGHRHKRLCMSEQHWRQRKTKKQQAQTQAYRERTAAIDRLRMLLPDKFKNQKGLPTQLRTLDNVQAYLMELKARLQFLESQGHIDYDSVQKSGD